MTTHPRNPPGTMAAIAVKELHRVASLIDAARQTETLCLLDWHQIRRYAFDCITDAAVNDGMNDDETIFPQHLPEHFYNGKEATP